MTDSLDATLEHDLGVLTHAGLRRTLRSVAHRTGATILLDGVPAVDFSSNDYLGLAGDPRIAAAASAFLHRESTGAAAARLISGNHPAHVALERDIARFKGTEAALLFSSGYTANIGTIPALVGKRDVIYADILNHASLIDATRLSRAEVRTFPHCDLGALRQMLQADTGKYQHRLIVVDGMFSMDGDLFPLDQLVPLAREFDAWTYIDDAHGTGVLGPTGKGITEHFGVTHEIDVIMGTLGKALGTSGAFIAGSATLIEFLLHRARTFVFTTATPPAMAAASLEAIRIVEQEPELRTRLRENIHRLRDGLIGIGHPAQGIHDSHIVPFHIGSSDATTRIGHMLREAGYLVGAVRPPTVPMGTSRLRITVTAAHTPQQIDGFVTTLRDTLRGVIPD